MFVQRFLCRRGVRSCSSAAAAEKKFDLESFKTKIGDGPSLDDFVEAHTQKRVVRKPLRSEPLPPWLKLQMIKTKDQNKNFQTIKKSMRASGLATVCEEARCPNIGECWGGGENETATATIMLMGDTCTRGCRFCAIKTSRAPPPLDPEEPVKTGRSVQKMGVDYVVMTMVDRDDLPDGGAAHIAACIRAIKEETAGKVLVECLTGDFQGNTQHIETVATAGLEVFAHNIECVERVSPIVRDRRAKYRQSLDVLAAAKTHGVLTKSSIMLGFGESDEEVRQTMRDLRSVGVDCVTLGQYLQPLRSRMKVAQYVHPDKFEQWRIEGEEMGFLYAASGPMVRSSYKAGEYFITNILKQRAAAAS
ncbi:Lipoyl synthase [Diplonema papillatum]|nr:Lipoyl synthase [Diplonema papillatum]